MPELPEVETTRRGIAPMVEGHRVTALRVREPRLRWPVPPEIVTGLPGQPIERIRRRAKYLLLETPNGTALLHLGMSGRLRLLRTGTPVEPHDHYDIELDSGYALRFNDPRRFGSLLWTTAASELHPLLAGLGPEPLSGRFDAAHLAATCRGRSVAIKLHIMNSRIVVGVGNIYANEALHRAGIDPRRAAGRISRPRLAGLVAEIKAVLEEAIRQGGTTLRDFLQADGSAGYFQNDHRVYERAGQPCYGCGRAIRRIVLGQRSTYFCSRCQR